jgi:hypothetical protein
MILDKNLLVSDAQDLAQTNASYLSDKSIDLWAGNAALPSIPGYGTGKPIADIGRGNCPELLVQVSTPFATSASGTLQVDLITATDAALTGSVTVLSSTPVLAASALVAGYQFRLGGIPAGITQRYLGLRYVIGTGAMSAGKITAGLVLDRQSNPLV